MGVDRCVREHHRSLMGGPGRLAGVRDAGDPCGAAGTGAARTRAVSDRIPLARPVIGQREEELVLETLRSGRLSLGPLLERFEQRFAQVVDAPLASAVSSGTAALHLAIRAAGVADGDEVITSPFSFVASANVAVFE